MTNKHTPTARPWRVGKNFDNNVYDADGRLVSACNTYRGKDKINAAHIVKAVNAYDDLMELVTEMRDCFDDLQDEYADCSMASFRESKEANDERIEKVQIHYALKFSDIISKNYEKIPRPALEAALKKVKAI